MREVLARVSQWFYEHKVTAGVGFLLILGFGVVSYTSLLSREGFPSIQFPLVIVNGTYFVDDDTEVDRQVTKPLAEALSGADDVSDVQTQARDNSFSATIFYDESVTPEEGLEQAQTKIDELQLPEQVQLSFTPIDPSGFLFEYTALVAVYDPANDLTLEQLVDEAGIYAERLQQLSEIDEAAVESPFETGVNPLTGQQQTQQASFSIVGQQQEASELQFSQSVIVGVKSSEDTDILELSAAIDNALADISSDTTSEAIIGADFATQLNEQISSLQVNLLTGVVAVAVMSLILISWRSSIVTGLFIVSVMVATFGVLLLIGYSINTITLFALVLALGLFVDDATIIVEAIDAEKRTRHGNTRPTTILKAAIKKVGLASMAGTLTTVFVFLPLAFVSGILGDFIRALPITVVVALVMSYLLSLTFIPFASRFTIFTKTGHSPMLLKWISAQVEWVAQGLANVINSAGKGLAAGLILLSIGVFMLSGVFAGRAGFNIFPSSKDANQLLLELQFSPDTTIAQAEAVADDINAELNSVAYAGAVKQPVTGVLYGGFNGANARAADATIDLVPYSDRELTAPEISKQLESAVQEVVGERADVSLGQIDAGPPADDFPFKVQLYGSRDQTVAFADEIQTFLADRQFELPTGEMVTTTDTVVQYADSIVRIDGRQLVQVGAAFDSDQTTAVLAEAEAAVKEFVATQSLDQYGLTQSDIEYDYGQETQNQESFAALGLVFPIAIGAMAILLGIQFRSLVQPLLIFLAIPFGFTGAFIALDITNNPLSFFSAVGLIGLTGIAVNNSILLIDYANQARSRGASARNAIAEATAQRFRPLLATTLTTIAALLPLAVYDPFWQPLAVAIIGGLISSTLLVVISLPYYYLATERARVLTKGWWQQRRAAN